jgi:Protein tyrosine and serine/threonine kinase
MAPEVVEKLPYDTQCDVFSFAVLLWEILALKPAFGGHLTPCEFRQRIVMRSERPPVHHREWPTATCQLLKEAWNETPQKRPTMDQVATVLRSELTNMSDAAEILNRTQHMKTRSFNSLKDLNLNSTFFQEMSELMTNAGSEKSHRIENVPRGGSVHSSRSGQ